MQATTKSFLVGTFLTLSCFGVYFGFKMVAARLRGNYSYYNSQAIERIRGRGIHLTDRVTDTYYFNSGGMQDQIVFLAFSGPRPDLDRIVEEMSGKQIATWSAWHGQLDELPEWYQPGWDNPVYHTYYYTLDYVKTGLFFQHSGKYKGDGWYIIYDRERCRVYYSD